MLLSSLVETCCSVWKSFRVIKKTYLVFNRVLLEVVIQCLLDLRCAAEPFLQLDQESKVLFGLHHLGGLWSWLPFSHERVDFSPRDGVLRDYVVEEVCVITVEFSISCLFFCIVIVQQSRAKRGMGHAHFICDGSNQYVMGILTFSEGAWELGSSVRMLSESLPQLFDHFN